MHFEDDFIFVDAGPIGLGGRGGHGHNDCLSFEAFLYGQSVVVDPGCYTYTSDYHQRNYYRSTAAHNTPMIAGEEINRFVSERNLWNLRNDAVPKVLSWQDTDEFSLFCATHSGYQRLDPAVHPIRTIVLDKKARSLMICDRFFSACDHTVEIPMHLGPDVFLESLSNDYAILSVNEMEFILEWQESSNWRVADSDYEYSPSYGVKNSARRLCWSSREGCRYPLIVCIYPGFQQRPGFMRRQVERHLSFTVTH